ncbi:[Fe-Fe] hydrogenase large subunit C-terminal domain-containing protein [Maribellus sp. YY47]|uniref:[Fe-Fe] hydrogenase large subunit C-terminal domain-containing protein n=1 Tax=Maribellus sp. YY47 TaxID=2929486 RepID=UPI0020013007|nr:[Fe-Fe] hydrogenase large subunit C-terminal domain-containing protein [Maribellus sp. YY47]MCK3686352.1 4Fe-4S binding protein [Maribellus sp. YY47]
MDKLQKYHAIKVNADKCMGCTHCMKACPTEAIRIRAGVAQINPDRCVDCGNCLRVCPVDAFYVDHDGLDQLRKFKYRVVLFPAVMIGQFPEIYTEGSIYEALLKLGFTHIFEVEQPIQLLIDSIREQVDAAESKPLISSFCPAIVRLIRYKYPSLIDNVVLIKAPHDLAAEHALELLKKEGASREEIGIFYISPCSAKMAAIKRPLGEKESIVDGLINMNDLYTLIMKVISKNEEADTSCCRDQLTRDGILWSLPRGEARHFKRKSMAVDGIHNVVKILERMENEDVPELDFLELKSCHQGCAGGILLTGNRFLTVERLQKRAKRYPVAKPSTITDYNVEELKERLKINPIQPDYVFALDPDRMKALEKMEKMQRILCQLPGIDCGGCGAPNCHALAEDMVQGKAKMSDCVFLQNRYLNENKLTLARATKNLEKAWGKNRFDADCNKRGGRNEGF